MRIDGTYHGLGFLTMLRRRIHDVLSRHLELRQLRKAAQSHRSPELPALVKVDPFEAVWRVSIPNCEPRFMSVSFGAIDHKFFVVHLDAERFYHAWLKASPAITRRHGSDCICRSQMPSDYKPKWAVDGFSHGVNNPVPLAEAGAHVDTSGRLHLDFTNGVTRTFWLLANRCPAFPVEVYGADSASLLHHVAGIGPEPQSLAEVFSNAQPYFL